MPNTNPPTHTLDTQNLSFKETTWNNTRNDSWLYIYIFMSNMFRKKKNPTTFFHIIKSQNLGIKEIPWNNTRKKWQITLCIFISNTAKKQNQTRTLFHSIKTQNLTIKETPWNNTWNDDKWLYVFLFQIWLKTNIQTKNKQTSFCSIKTQNVSIKETPWNNTRYNYRWLYILLFPVGLKKTPNFILWKFTSFKIIILYLTPQQAVWLPYWQARGLRWGPGTGPGPR